MKIKQGEQTYDTRNYSEIPDLWHIANAHPDPVAKEAILKTWHVAHAYMRALNATQGDADRTIDITGA